MMNVAGGGIVTPYSGQCYFGQIVTCMEQPNPGYAFNGWYVNGAPAVKPIEPPINNGCGLHRNGYI